MRSELRKRLINAIDLDGYGDKYAPTLKGLKELFLDEFFHIDQMKRKGGGLARIASEWFRGLPSAVDVPFYYEDTNALMVKCGYDVEGMDEVDVDDMYWKELGEILVGE